MSGSRTSYRARILSAVLILVLIPASAGQSATIKVGAGDFEFVTVEDDITKIAVSSPDIADYSVGSKREILVTGKKPGKTSLKIWTASGGQITHTIDVQAAAGKPAGDASESLKAKVQKIINNPDVVVTRTERGAVISGYVETESEKEKAEKVVRAYLVDAKADVTNVLDIRKKSRQVKLKIRVMEITESVTKTFGINWGTFQYGAVTTVTTPATRFRDEFILSGTAKTSSFPRVIAPLRRSDPLTAVDPMMLTINNLLDSGIIKLLSAPDIVALSGSKTDVVIGGQIPIPSSSSSGGTTQTSIDWRDYGIKMSVQPNIVDANRVTAKIAVEVSSLDGANAITISGSVIPAMKITQAQSEINVEAGKTVFLSGLKQEKKTKTVVGIPFLSELPAFGGLFGTHVDDVDASDLVISVTPEIIDEDAN